ETTRINTSAFAAPGIVSHGERRIPEALTFARLVRVVQVTPLSLLSWQQNAEPMGSICPPKLSFAESGARSGPLGRTPTLWCAISSGYREDSLGGLASWESRTVMHSRENRAPARGLRILPEPDRSRLVPPRLFFTSCSTIFEVAESCLFVSLQKPELEKPKGVVLSASGPAPMRPPGFLRRLVG